MTYAAVAWFAAALLIGFQPAPSPHPQLNSTVNAERIEGGQLTTPGGSVIAYRIRLLPLASFPDLPVAVNAQLARRSCMIPQTFEAKEPENVIHGALRSAGSNDWATLCSAAGSSTLYVFFAGQYDSPISLRTQPDTAWLGAEPGSSVFSSAWGIALRRSSELRASPHLRPLASPDHDGIEDARLERSVTVHYFQNGKWILLEGGS